MFDVLHAYAAGLRRLVHALEPDQLSGDDAAALVDRFAAVERLAATGKALAAARAADAGRWRADAARSPADWLARRTGTSVGAAKQALDAAAGVRSLTETATALRDGALSIEQAAAVADAARVAPAHERDLLATAATTSLRALRVQGERVKAAALPDAAAREEAIRRRRSLRHWVDETGAWHLHARGTKEAGATFMARLQPFVDAAFTDARSSDRREEVEAYAFDGLLALAQSGGSSKPVTKVVVRADLAALRRGSVAGEEVCEIAGFGPVAVPTVRAMLGESALALVLTNGVDVVNVTHFGRHPTAHQQTALEWAQPECSVEGCSATARLERDHRIEWSTTKHTRFDELDRLCHAHHTMKTAGTHRLAPGTGKRPMVAVPP